jgi:O-antigen/teichoic acid export membrane protein
MAATHGRDPAGLDALFQRLNRLWTATVLGATVLGAATLYPFIDAWLGSGHGEAAELGTFLVAGYGLSLLTGPGVGYLRALGRPGLEARLGLVTMTVNIVLTVLLGLLAGAIGVVIATLAAFAIANAWFFRRLAQVTAVRLPPPEPGAVVAALVAGLLSFGWGLAMVDALGRWASLVSVAAGAGVAFVLYLSYVTGVRPTWSTLRALLA